MPGPELEDVHEKDTKIDIDVELFRKRDEQFSQKKRFYVPAAPAIKSDKKKRVIDLSEWELDDDLLDEHFSKSLFKKPELLDFDLHKFTIKSISIDQVLQSLYLPTINNSNKIIIENNSRIKRTLTDEEFSQLLRNKTKDFTAEDHNIFKLCLDYYKGFIPEELMKSNLRAGPIKKVLPMLHSIKPVLEDKDYILKQTYQEISPLLNTKQYNIHVALHLVKLPKISSQISYNIVLSESDVIDPTSDNIDTQVHKLKKHLSSDELDLINICVDYYEGVYPHKKMIHILQNYSGKLNKVIQFLYNCKHII